MEEEEDDEDPFQNKETFQYYIGLIHSPPRAKGNTAILSLLSTFSGPRQAAGAKLGG